MSIDDFAAWVCAVKLPKSPCRAGTQKNGLARWLRNGLGRLSLYSRNSSTRRHRRRQLSRYYCSISPRGTGLEQPHLGQVTLYQRIDIEDSLFLGTPNRPSRWSLLPSRLLLSAHLDAAGCVTSCCSATETLSLCLHVFTGTSVDGYNKVRPAPMTERMRCDAMRMDFHRRSREQSRHSARGVAK